MANIFVVYRMRYMNPMEAIVAFHDAGRCIQEIVNAFLEADVKNFSWARIRNLIRIYRKLKESGKYSCPCDLEMAEMENSNNFNEKKTKAVFEKFHVFVIKMGRNEAVPQAIIHWYQLGETISSMENMLKDEGISSYNSSRIMNIIKIYKRLKKSDNYNNIVDIELEEPGPETCEQETRKNKQESALEENEKEISEDYEENVAENDEEIEGIVGDPLPIFEELNNLVMMVAQRLTAALLVTGPGGIGKSYSVERVLSKFGSPKKDFVVMKGKCTASAMYDFLFKNHNKICVFDDCDSVLCDKEGIAVLKGALDSGKNREISWNTRGADMVDTFDCNSRKEVLAKLEKWSKRHGGRKGIPTHFQFEGSVIFISNMTCQEIKAKDCALLTRCSVVDISVTNEEVIERLGALLPNFQIFDARGKSITNMKMKEEVYEWISSNDFLEHPKMRGKNVDFRMFIKAYKARYAKIPMWKEMSFAC